jgi:hypothetical protein
VEADGHTLHTTATEEEGIIADDNRDVSAKVKDLLMSEPQVF